MNGRSVIRNGRCKPRATADRKSTRLNSSHSQISYAVFCLKKKKNISTDAVNGKLVFASDGCQYFNPNRVLLLYQDYQGQVLCAVISIMLYTIVDHMHVLL